MYNTLYNNVTFPRWKHLNPEFLLNAKRCHLVVDIRSSFLFKNTIVDALAKDSLSTDF